MIVTRLERGQRHVLALESGAADEQVIPRATTTSERATIAHATSLMVHEHVRQIMIMPEHQPARRFLADGVRALPGCELATERPRVPTVGLYFTTATLEMCDRLTARQAKLDERATLAGLRADP